MGRAGWVRVILGVGLALVLWTATDITEAQDTTGGTPFSPLAQDGVPLYSYSEDGLPVVLTDEEKAVVEALFSGNPTVYPPPADGDVSAQINLSDFPGLFTIFESIAVNTLCALACDPSDTLEERAENVFNLMQSQYNDESIKYFGYMKVSIPLGVGSATPTLYFDLTDMAKITEEGQDNYVTVWFSLGGEISLSLLELLPEGIGIIPFERIPGSDDPSNSWSVSGLAASLPFYTCTAIQFDSQGEITSGCNVDKQVSLSINFTLVSGEVNLARFELRTSYLRRAMTDFLAALGPNKFSANVDVGLDQVLPELFDFLLNYGVTGAALALIPQEGELRAFTCLDNGAPCVQEGQLRIVAGCADSDGNGIRDNVCEPNADGTVTAVVDVVFVALSTGDNVCYKVELDVPTGWDYDWPYGTRLNPFWGNCDTDGYGETVAREWTVERVDPEATSRAELVFELYSTRNTSPVPGLGRVVDERTVVLFVGAVARIDVNGDGFITPSDALFVVNILTAGGYDANADVNGDNVVDVTDYNLVVGSLGS